MERPERDHHNHSQLIFEKEKRQYNRTRTVSSTNGARTSGNHPPHTKMNTDIDFTTFIKANSNGPKHKTQNNKTPRK